MLAVDGKDPPGAASANREREVAGSDEALLVCKREIDAVLERPQRGMDAREPDNRIQDHVRFRLVEQLGEVAADLLERRVDVVERRRAGRNGAELQLGMRFD